MKTIQNIWKKETLASWNDPVVLIIFGERVETFQNVTLVNYFYITMINQFLAKLTMNLFPNIRNSRVI